MHEQSTLNTLFEDAKSRAVQRGADVVNADNKASLLERLFKIVNQFVQCIAGTFVEVLMYIARDVVLPLKALINIANKVWHANLQLINMVTQMQSSSRSPDLRFTWVQEPIKFEDAFGRIFPIPSELCMERVRAIIWAQFSESLARQKVSSGEYELFNSLDSAQILAHPEDQLRPGTSITMAMVIGHYGPVSLKWCPRPGCRSPNVQEVKAGGIEWQVSYFVHIGAELLTR